MGAKRKMEITAGILAGGRSRRMGKDKARLEVNGKPLLQHVIDRLEPHFEALIVAANDSSYADLGISCVPDILGERCALTGVHAILSAAETDWCFITACDMPHASPDLVRFLLDRRERFDRIAPGTDRGVEPLHALYSKACLVALETAAAEGRWKLQDFWNLPGARVIPVEDTTPFFNVNTPEDLRSIEPLNG